MEGALLNGIVQKTQDMEPPPSQNRDQDSNYVADDDDRSNSDAQQKKISEEDKESDEKSPLQPQAEDEEDSGAVQVEKEVVKSVVDSFMSLPAEAQEFSPNVERAVAKSLGPDHAAIVIEEVAHNNEVVVENKPSQSPEEKVGNSSIANPDHVGMNEPASDENTKIAPTVTDVVPEGIQDKLLPSPDEYGIRTPSDYIPDDEKPEKIEEKENGDSDRDSPPKDKAAGTGETSAIFDEEAVPVNNADALSKQSADIPGVGVGSSDGGERPENSVSNLEL